MNSLIISDKTTTSPAIWEDRPIPLASVLAHEVRNPLTNIYLSIQMLESQVMDDSLKLFIDIIKRSSTRISDLINDFIKEQPAHEIQTEKYSLHQMLDEVIEMAGDRIKLKNIVVTKNYTAHDFNIALDNPKIKIALTNIIINAVDAMSSKGGELSIVTELINDSLTLSISDNGCGISKNNLPFIFKPYFTNKPGGLGVGLAATYEILRSNHIHVNVESEKGKGTNFILLFEKIKITGKRITLKNRQPRVFRNKMLSAVVCKTGKKHLTATVDLSA